MPYNVNFNNTIIRNNSNLINNNNYHIIHNRKTKNNNQPENSLFENIIFLVFILICVASVFITIKLIIKNK